MRVDRMITIGNGLGMSILFYIEWPRYQPCIRNHIETINTGLYKEDIFQENNFHSDILFCMDLLHSNVVVQRYECTLLL